MDNESIIKYTNSVKTIGIDPVPVTVECQVSKGIGIHMIGLVDMQVKESLLRTVTGLQAVGYRIPGKKLVINIAPAELRKSGAGYDLPIALAIIAASEQKSLPLLNDFLVIGEIGLNGSIRGVTGATIIADYAVKNNIKGIIIPRENAEEVIPFSNGTKVYCVSRLDQAVDILEGIDMDELLVQNIDVKKKNSSTYVDFADIKGYESVKRAMEIAAAGGHNLMLVGPVNNDKIELARAFASILPPMTKEEILETAKIYSVAGKEETRIGNESLRPVRIPHYSSSLRALWGGGESDNIRPGEVSLAHNGVLVIDEFSLWPKAVTEAMRAVVEDKRITISRLSGKIVFPAKSTLIFTNNCCPCGHYGNGTDRCTCTSRQRAAYMAKMYGPVYDRIDVQAFVNPNHAVNTDIEPESSETIRQRVMKARAIQLKRFGTADTLNADMLSKTIEIYCKLDDSVRELLEMLVTKMGLSARAYMRMIRIARTIADIEGSETIKPQHITEAAGYRFLDRNIQD